MASSSENFDICKTLLEEVDDITFVDDDIKLKNYLCVACGYVAISHCFANCGDVFCTRCYQIYYKRHCPFCEAILASNNHYNEFEADILRLKVQCKFINNGCKDVVLLRDFLKHNKSCRFSTAKIKPKLYKENPIAEALEKFGVDFKRMEEEIKSMRDKFASENANQNKEATDKIQTEVTHLKEKVLESKEKTKAMTKEIQRLESRLENAEQEARAIDESGKKLLESNAVIFKKLIEDEMQNKSSAEFLRSEMTRLKEEMKEAETQRKLLTDDEQFKRIALEEEMKQIKEDLRKSEDTIKEQQNQNKSIQEKEIDELRTTSLQMVSNLEKVTDKIKIEVAGIKETMRQSEDKIKQERESLTKTMDKVSDNKKATDRINAEVTLITKTIQESKVQTNDQIKQEKDSLIKKIEGAIREVKDESKRQIENIKKEYKNEILRLEKNILDSKIQMVNTKTDHISEIRKLETRIHESKTEMEKTKTEHQSEILTLKSEHKRRIDELLVVKSQYERHLEILEERVNELQYHHKDDGSECLPDIFIWKIPGITQIMKELVEKKPLAYNSEEYFTNQNGRQFKPLICAVKENEYVNIILEFMAANSSEPYLHSRRFILIDQSTSMRKNNVEMIDRPQCKMNFAKDMMATSLSTSLFFPPLVLQGENKYVKNDAIMIKIILEPIAFLWKQIEAQDGVYLWRINDYSKKKRDEINGVNWCLTSQPFKTSHVGYTAHLQLFLNGYGDDEGKYISMYLRFLLGEHDDSLPLPFKCKFKYSLLDQSDSPTKENISKEFTYEFTTSQLLRGFAQFVLQSTVESSKYLKNDSIVIQTTAKIL